MAGQDNDVVTAYPNHAPNKQEQNLPGLDAKMDPLASHTQLEKWDENGKPYLEEYAGNGRLKGKTAIVTGGDSGIGRSVALMFAREGANVSIVYLPAEQKDADDIVAMCAKNAMGSKEMHCIPADLMDEKAAKGVVDEHLKKWGRLDILVNNASKQIECKDFSQVDLAQAESVVRSNLLGMFALTKYSIPHLGRGACIINSSSVTARKGSLGMVDYSSTKGAIDTFTRSMAGQLMKKGVRVNAVAPGPVVTPLQPASRSGESMEGWAVGEPALLWQRPSQPAEQGPAYVFLADAGQSNQITGCVLPVNSGSYFTS
ncbi:NAD(P)-binding protein [Jaminaea rosea]|uniref:NAD(P)-binding protein n=1 Tax=Jaminaea rosea TaxID=1569628 RepID=A0A316UP83_9BASI|nr:NAD(P)-binding protein [Jaminaea rosea]PWN26774.1 NAD(P)-binding protein [Jaminaea rosea]